MLEEAIKENTTVLRQLLAALASGATVAALPKPADKTPAAASKAPAATPQTTEPLDYEKHVKPLALKVAKDEGRETLVKILETFKVAQANLLKPDQFADFTKACNAALAVAA